MLSVFHLREPRDRAEIFAEFAPDNATWIVSELQSKLDLQRALLRRQAFLPGDCLLRASELWRVLLTRLRPDLQVVSREFMCTLIGENLAARGLDWARTPGASQAAYEYMTQLMPILSHPNGREMMAEWFVDNLASQARWGRWHDLGQDLWQDFLRAGFIAPAWASGVLTNEVNLLESWDRPLFVNLGAKLDQVEADLFAQLSERIDVTILQPKPAWVAEYAKALKSYEVFASRGAIRPCLAPSENLAGHQPEFRKFTTMLAEIKEAVAQVRHWLDAPYKPPPSRIAIVAPDLESYWAPLADYLIEEGIPCQKDQICKLHGYPDVASWLATLRLRTGRHSEADLELALYDGANSDRPQMNYERFKVLYSSIYAREDLGRAGAVARRFRIELGANDLATRDDFVAWSLRQWPQDGKVERIEKLLKRLFSECPQGMELRVERWLSYLEELASRAEWVVRAGDADGISYLNLSSAENSEATHMIVLGLTESSLKPQGGTAVLFGDILSLGARFGFHLASADRAAGEFEARWLASETAREMVLSVPETDFGGSAQASSWIWVRGAREQGVNELLSLPQITRWDEVQKSSLAVMGAERRWSQAHVRQLATALAQDLEGHAIDDFGAGLITHLSPSGIEDYLECPFVYAAKRVFRLSDMAELDLEVDAARRGSLMHKIFEVLCQEPMRFDYRDEELIAVIESARASAGIELADERLWAALRTAHLDLARRFLALESEERRLYPETKTIAREAEISGFLDTETGELRSVARSPGDLKFVGRIDRVDSDQAGNLLVYDYKSSASNLSQYSSWLKGNKIQLLLYAMAIESGLASFAGHQVVGALYYVAKPLNRDYGFKLKDIPQGLFDVTDGRKRNRIVSAEKESLFAEARERVKIAAQGILAGQFQPSPRDPKKCTDCQWSNLCRAPHLNT